MSEMISVSDKYDVLGFNNTNDMITKITNNYKKNSDYITKNSSKDKIDDILVSTNTYKKLLILSSSKEGEEYRNKLIKLDEIYGKINIINENIIENKKKDIEIPLDKKKCSGCEVIRDKELFINEKGKEYKTCIICRNIHKKNYIKVIPVEIDKTNLKKCSGCSIEREKDLFINEKGKEYKTCINCRNIDKKTKGKSN